MDIGLYIDTQIWWVADIIVRDIRGDILCMFCMFC